jgi:hypothetical protein
VGSWHPFASRLGRQSSCHLQSSHVITTVSDRDWLLKPCRRTQHFECQKITAWRPADGVAQLLFLGGELSIHPQNAAMEAIGYYCTALELCIGFVQGIPIYLELQWKPLLYFEQTVMPFLRIAQPGSRPARYGRQLAAGTAQVRSHHPKTLT